MRTTTTTLLLPTGLLVGLMTLTLALATERRPASGGPDLSGAAPQTADEDYAAARARAEALVAEGSHAAARAIYAGLDRDALGPDARRWVEFRLADLDWRAAPADADPTRVEAARAALRELAPADAPRDEQDRVWAEAQASLGDSHWARARTWDTSTAYPHYERALDWWARSSDLDLARERWLHVFWTMARPDWAPGAFFANYGRAALPRRLVEQALELARDDEERAQTEFALAQLCWQTGDEPRLEARAFELLERIAARGRSVSVHDDALFALGQRFEQWGAWERDDEGRWAREPDPAAALAWYRRLVEAYTERTSGVWRRSRERIDAILEPEVTVWAPGAFLPGSDLGYGLAWRNADRARVALYRIDLLDGLEPARAADGDWLEAFALRRGDRVASVELELEADHARRTRMFPLELEDGLAPGAYLLHAAIDGDEDRALLLVTDVVVVLAGVGQDLTAWVVDAEDGEPLESARVVAFVDPNEGRTAAGARRVEGTTDADGLVRLDLGPLERASVRVSVAHEDGVATASQWVREPGARERFQALVTTDRPAYRPGQTVRWSMLVREFADGWRALAGELALEVVGPRGERVAERTVTCSEFGSVHGELETGADWSLGAYRVQVRRGVEMVGSATLFRLEEYRRPEFRVRVELPRDGEDRPETFVLGDAVRAEVVAETYAGAPVAGADVEVVVRRRPFEFALEPPRPYPWFRVASAPDPILRLRSWAARGVEVERLSLTTDEEGRAPVELATSAFDETGREYTLEARVTDALRREVAGTGTVRVGRTAFGAAVELDHRIFAPGAPLEATVRAEDSNGHPVAVSGTATLVRVTELSDAAFEARFGPDAEPGPERPREVEEELERVSLELGDDGRARWSVRTPGPGTYLVRFDARDARTAARVTAEARAYVADEDTTGVGLRAEGLALEVDETRVGEGEEVLAILLADRDRRPVLFTSASNGRVDVQVIRPSGVAKVVRLPVDERHVPEVTLRARAVQDGDLLQDTATVTVAPVRRLLEVEAALDGEEASDGERRAPGDEATIALRVTDHRGRPVEAELSLTLYDAALTAIQADLTPDPLELFHGRGRSFSEVVGSSLMGRAHERFRWDAELELFGTPEELERERRARDGSDEAPGRSKARGERPAEEGVLALGMAARAPAAEAAFDSAEVLDSELGIDGARGLDGASGLGADEGPSNVVVRSDFRETAVWAPAVRTDADGRARVPFTFPDSTTAWNLTALVHDGGSRFGIERREAARTALPLLLRLATPRFMVDGDVVLFSTLVRNDTGAPVTATVDLAIEGAELLGVGGDPMPPGPAGDAARRLELAAGEERTLDWRVRTTEPGEIVATATVRADEHSDGIERRLPVLEHGLEVLIAGAGALEGERSELTLDLPPARPGSTAVEVVVTPSLAATAIEALPYLADYPYGCLEQTLSRFVPTVVTLDALERLGIAREAVAAAAFLRGADRRPPGDAEATLDGLDRMAAEGLERVLSMQTASGGFPWWPGGEPDVYMSGYAVWALALADGAGLDVPRVALEGGRRFLVDRLTETAESDPELAAWCLHAVVAADGRLGGRTDADTVAARFDAVLARREALGAYGRALLLLAAKGLGRTEAIDVLVRNLLDGVHLEDGPGGGVLQPDAVTTGRRTARWGDEGLARRWSQDGVEATAFALRALLAVDPEHELVEPAIEWLVLERRGSAWKSTRDTAVCVLALIDTVERRGELARETGYRLLVDGEVRAEARVGRGPEALVPRTWPLGDLGAGEHTLVLERLDGSGRLYWSAAARTFSIADRIRPRANELAVRRDVLRLVGRDTLLAGKVFERVPLADGEAVAAGDRIEVVLTFETRAALEYLAIEDLKPAGLEAVEQTSGYGPRLRELRADEVERRFGAGLNALPTVGDAAPTTDDGYTGRSRGAYRELRDTRVVHFVDRLPPGVWELRTTLRAETPGTFAALPARAHAMYAPDLAGNSWELTLQVTP